MYCSQCGKQISEQSVFCSYCGTKVGEEVNKQETDKVHRVNETNNDHVLFSYKPQFHGSYVVKKLIPAFIFFSFFLSILITIIRAAFIGLVVADPFEASPFKIGNVFFAILVSFLLVIVFGYSIYRKRYENAEFKFFNDRMEYIDGFFNYNKKQIYYKNIIEVSMSQNVFQRSEGIGSVRLTTSGITYTGDRAHSNGITVYDIPNSDEAYQNLKRLIK